MALATFETWCRILMATLMYVEFCGRFCDNIAFFCNAQKIHYMSLERPNLTYYDHRYITHATINSRRYGRQSPFYYVSIHVDIIYPVQNNITVDIYFFELLTNVYKRSFVEMHIELCHLISDDNFIGTAIKRGLNGTGCPFLPGQYQLNNMTIDSTVIARNFPFRKGRVYANITSLDTKKLVASGYIHMEIKETTIKTTKKTYI